MINPATVKTELLSFLGSYRTNVEATVFDADLPILGADFSNGMDQVDLVLDEIELALDALDALDPMATAQDIANALDLITVGGVNVFDGNTVAGTGGTDLTVDLVLSETLTFDSISIDADLGLTAGAIDLQTGLDFSDVNFGMNLFLQLDAVTGDISIRDPLAGTDPEFTLDLAGDFDGVEGALGFLDFAVAGDGSTPNVEFNFGIDLSETITAMATFQGGLNLGVQTGSGEGALPVIGADVVVDYTIAGTASQVQAGLDATVSVGLENITVDPGSLVDFFNQIFGQIDLILDTFPLGVAIDILTQELPVVSDISKYETVADLIDIFDPNASLEFIDVVIDILEVAEAVGQLGSLDGPIALGDVSVDLSSGVSLGFDDTVNLLGSLGGFDDALSNTLGWGLQSDGSFSDFISIPLFEDPFTVVANTILNGFGTAPQTLIEIDLPELSFGARAEIFFPVGPVRFFLDGNFSASTDFTLGYDTFGFSGSGVDFAQGFYVMPTDSGAAFAEVSFGLGAGGGAGIGVGSVDVRGGVTGTIEFTLAAGDGTRTRLSDLTSFPCIFSDISGRVTADLAIEISIGIKPLKITERITIGEVTLANFNLGDPCSVQSQQLFNAGLGTTAIISNSLLLTAGELFNQYRTLPDFIDRKPNGNPIINETFSVTKAPTPEGAEEDPNALAVYAFGYFETFTAATPFDSIVADGGLGNDYLSVASDITIAAQFAGGDDADVLIGGAAGDTLSGEDGADQLFGGGGNDTLFGGIGDDFFDGGAGADVIYGGEELGVPAGAPGEDLDEVDYSQSSVGVTLTRDATNIFQINGSGGDAAGDRLFDIEYFRGSQFADTIEGSVGQSNVLQGNDGDDSLLGGVFDDLITGGLGADSIDGAAGDDTVSWALSTAAVWADIGPNVYWGGESTGDDITNVENYQLTFYNDFFEGDPTLGVGDVGHQIRALSGDDILLGSSLQDTIFAGSGDDVIFGQEQGDTIDGGGDLFTSAEIGTSDTGTDLLTYENNGSGVTVTLGNAGTPFSTGADVITPLQIINAIGSSSDVVGFSTIENLTGSDFADFLTGDAGSNVIRGLDGIDDVDGGGGSDTLIGGVGGDTVIGGSGIDWAFYDESDAAVDIDLNDTTGSNGSGGHAAGDTVTGVENLLGSAFADTLLGDSGANILDPGQRNTGTEIIQGRGGIDTLQLNRSDNSNGMTFEFTGIPILFNFDIFEGTSTTASYDTNSIEQIWVTTGSGNDTIVGTTAADSLTNLLSGDDIVNSGGGADVIAVGLGRDIIDAGGGSDTVFRNSAGAETFFIEGGVGVDTLNATLADEDGDIVLISQGLVDTVFDQQLFLEDGAVIQGFEVFQGIITGSGNDTLVQDGEVDNIFNTGDGADQVTVNFGNNVLAGGESTDTGGATHVDVLTMDFSSAAAGSYVEAFWFGGDNIPQAAVVFYDAPFQEAGETFYQDFERLDITGTSGNDEITGISPNETDVVEGDIIRGRAGDDELAGGAGNDSLNGGADTDILYGGAGDDVLRGGTIGEVAEVDTLFGGAGADTFQIGGASGSFYGLGAAALDDYAFISDFSIFEGDTIELAGAIGDYSIALNPVGTSIEDADGDRVAFLDGVLLGNLTSPSIVFVPLDMGAGAPGGEVSESVAASAIQAALGFSAEESLSTDPFTISDVVEPTDLRDRLQDAIYQIENPITPLNEVTNLTVTFEGDDAAVGLFENAPWCLADGVVISTGVARQITGVNQVDGTSQPGQTAASPISLDFQKIGVTAGNSAVFAAQIPDLPGGLQSITLGDAYNFEGAGGIFAGFDMDGIVLSRTLITSVNASTDLTDPSVLPQLDVFDFSAAGTFFTPGAQNERFDPTTMSTVPAGQNLAGTINGMVDQAFATLDQIDYDQNGAFGGAFALGDGGEVSFQLTDAVDTSTPLYMYVAEAFSNDEDLSGLVTVSDRSVSDIGDLNTDLGAPGEDGDTSILRVEFDYAPSGISLSGLRIEDLFKIVIVSEELPENGGSLAEDIVSVRVNGFEAAVLSDGQQATLGNLALSPNGPFHPDLNLNLVGTGDLEQTIRADAYSEVLTISGPLLGIGGPTATRNVIEFEVADRGDGDLDTAIFIAPWLKDTVTGTAQNDSLTGGEHDDTFFGLDGDDSHYGGCGDDTYYFDTNVGDELVVEAPDCGYDTIEFGPGIDADDITFFRGDNADFNDLVIHVNGTFSGQQVVIDGQYEAFGNVVPAVERLLFFDGTEIDLTGGLTFTGSSADEQFVTRMFGTEFDDTMIGLEGQDALNGEAGNDTYLFRLQDMNGDFVGESPDEGFDTVRFGPGITADQIFFQRTGDPTEFYNLTIYVGSVGAASNIVLTSHFDGEFVRGGVEQLVLDDGTTFDLTRGLTFTGNDNVVATVEEMWGTQFADVILVDEDTDGPGSNSIQAGAGNDEIRGGDGNDLALGQAGDDVIVLGLGADNADGGQGNDTVEGGAGGDSLAGGIGVDTLSYASSAAGVFVNLGDGTAAGGDATGDSISGFENALGTAQSDQIFGTVGQNTLNGGEGNDILRGAAGNDTLEGGGGFDFADYRDVTAPPTESSPGTFVVDLANPGNSSAEFQADTLIDIKGIFGSSTMANHFNGDELRTFFTGGALGDTIAGNGGSDILRGFAGNDTITGGDGNDALLGNAGNDTLTGGGDRDIFWFGLGVDGDDVITDFTIGSDLIGFQGSSVSQLSDLTFATSTNGWALLEWNGGADSVELEDITVGQANSAANFFFA